MKRAKRKFAFIVTGSSGSYDEQTSWAVEVWTDKDGADCAAADLNDFARTLREALSNHSDIEPRDEDEAPNDPHIKKWTAWNAKRDRIIKRHRRLADDPNLERDAQYCVVKVPLV